MKIEITDEPHLKAVCEVLESIGYKPVLFTPNKDTAFIVCYESGNFTDWGRFNSGSYSWDLTTLTDLLKMRDEKIKGYING